VDKIETYNICSEYCDNKTQTTMTYIRHDYLLNVHGIYAKI
jgi:hypothetical protein